MHAKGKQNRDRGHPAEVAETMATGAQQPFGWNFKPSAAKARNAAWYHGWDWLRQLLPTCLFQSGFPSASMSQIRVRLRLGILKLLANETSSGNRATATPFALPLAASRPQSAHERTGWGTASCASLPATVQSGELAASLAAKGETHLPAMQVASHLLLWGPAAGLWFFKDGLGSANIPLSLPDHAGLQGGRSPGSFFREDRKHTWQTQGPRFWRVKAVVFGGASPRPETTLPLRPATFHLPTRVLPTP